MATFLKHPKFWLPLALLLVIEGLFRIGVWERMAKPGSYAGTSIATKAAAESFGFDRITGVTLGDSRTVYGFDHDWLATAASQAGDHHVSLAMGGSHLAGLKTVAEWSLRQMPQLERVVIGVAPGSMNRIGNGSYEVALVAPFRQQRHYWQLVEHFPPRRGDLRSLGSLSALMAYREDLVDYLLNPRGRHKALERAAAADPVSRLTFSNPRHGNLCEFRLQSLAQCRSELERLRVAGHGATPAAQTFATYCRRPRAAALPESRRQALAHWTGWLSELSAATQVVLVLMPEHPLLHHPEDLEAVRSALAPWSGSANFRVLDLSGLYAEQECRWFSDLVHANQEGARLATEALVDFLAYSKP